MLRGQYFTNEELEGQYQGLPLYITQARNLASSRYEGLELAFEHRPSIGPFYTVQGSLQRGYTYNLSPAFYSTIAGGPYSTNLTIFNNSNFNGSALARIPYAQGFASLGYGFQHGGDVALNITYYGNYNTFYRPPFFTFDLDSSIVLSKRIALNLSFVNLGDAYPQLFATQQQ